MTTKIFVMLIAAAFCSAFGCSQMKDAPTANGGNANRTIVVANSNAAPQAVTVSDGNSSIQVKQNDPGANNKVEITGGKGEKLKVENSTDVDDDDTTEVSDDRKDSVKTTTKDGKKTTIITDGSNDKIETKTDDKSKQTVVRDGKNNQVTITPGGVTLKDKKGNKIVIPQ